MTAACSAISDGSLVAIEFYMALSGEPVAYKTEAEPDSNVGALLPGLCAATGLIEEETALVFEGECLSNDATLARPGIRGAAQIGVVVLLPSHSCPDCGAITNVTEARDWLRDYREICAREGTYMVPHPDTLSNRQALGWWCDYSDGCPCYSYSD